MNKRPILTLVVLVQIVCASFFVAEILISVLGLPFGPFNWTLHELIEVGAAIGLVIGTLFGIIALRAAQARSAKAEEALRLAQSAFREVLEERFTEWKLTPAERDVALFAIKGYSTQEMAGFRGVSEGTIKAQTNAIYRKAGVTGRSQLLSLFIDELIEADQPSQSSQA